MAKTAEELKAEVRDYADANFPSWRSATISIRIGDIGDDIGERLLVIASPPGQAPRSFPQPSLSSE